MERTNGRASRQALRHFVQAVCWVACPFLGYRENPTGAAERRLGKKALVNRLRGDASTLLSDATAFLSAYRDTGM
jgi:hypothetical protein